MREAHDLVRGVFWGTLLSSRHIEALGGVRRVLDEAPVERAIVLGRAVHELVYLELTHDLFTVTEADEERLQAYLAPILPRASRQGSG